MKLIKHNDYIAKLFEKDPKFRKEYEKWDPSFEVGEMLVEARIIKGITQTTLAKMIQTKQQSIARAENGKHLPNLSFLVKIAKALKTRLIIRFGFMEEDYTLNYKSTMVQEDTKTHISDDNSNVRILNHRNGAANDLRFAYPGRRYA